MAQPSSPWGSPIPLTEMLFRKPGPQTTCLQRERLAEGVRPLHGLERDRAGRAMYFRTGTERDIAREHENSFPSRHELQGRRRELQTIRSAETHPARFLAPCTPADSGRKRDILLRKPVQVVVWQQGPTGLVRRQRWWAERLADHIRKQQQLVESCDF